MSTLTIDVLYRDLEKKGSEAVRITVERGHYHDGQAVFDRKKQMDWSFSKGFTNQTDVVKRLAADAYKDA